MSENHNVMLAPWWQRGKIGNLLSWFFLGVNSNNWKEVCKKCGYTGQVHLHDPKTCWRFTS